VDCRFLDVRASVEHWKYIHIAVLPYRGDSPNSTYEVTNVEQLDSCAIPHDIILPFLVVTLLGRVPSDIHRRERFSGPFVRIGAEWLANA